MTAAGWPLRLLLPAVVALVAVFDLVLPQPATDTDAQVTVSPLDGQVVAASDALTSTWFCPIVYLDSAGLNTAGVSTGGLTAEVVLENITPDPIRASVELRVSNRPTQVIDALVGPYGSETLPLEGVAFESDQFISATVEAASGGLVVTRRFTGDTGRDVASCSTVVTDHWYVAAGDTQRDATNLLVMFNPLPREAIVDVTFGTELESGALRPQELRGLVVPGTSSLVVDVGQYVRRRDLTAAHIEALAGRIVVDHVATYDGSAGRRGLSVELAGVETSTDWLAHVPAVGPGRRQLVGVLNPTDEVAEVQLEIVADQVDLDGVTVPPTATSVGVLDAVSVAVAPGDATMVRIVSSDDVAAGVPVDDAGTGDLDTGELGNGEAGQLTLRVPRGLATTVTVSSINAVGVAVTTEVVYGSADDPAASSAQRDAGTDAGTDASSAVLAGGMSIAPAQPAPGRHRWVVVLPRSAASEAYVTVHPAPVAVLDATSSDLQSTPAVTEGAVLLADGRATATFTVGADAPVTLRVPTGGARVIATTGPVVVSATVLDELPSVSIAAPLGY